MAAYSSSSGLYLMADNCKLYNIAPFQFGLARLLWPVVLYCNNAFEDCNVVFDSQWKFVNVIVNVVLNTEQA